jgi:mxaA protein
MKRATGLQIPVLARMLFPLLACLSSFQGHARTLDSRLERDFGAVMGSVLHQSIVLEADPGTQLEDNLLPAAGSPVNDWLEVRGSGWRQEQRGDQPSILIDIDYQVFKGVRQAERLTLPPISLGLRKGAESLPLDTPPLAFTLSPLIPEDMPDDTVTLRPLHPAPDLPRSAHGAGLLLWLFALAGLALFAAWHLGMTPFFARESTQAFSATAREIRRLRRAPGAPDASRRAFQAFHRALNQYAGRTVLEAHLPSLMEEHPQLAELHGEFEALFAQSHRLFFIPGTDDSADDFPLSRLEQLCRRCQRLSGRRA